MDSTPADGAPTTREEIAAWLRQEIATLLEIEPAAIDTSAAFETYGLASSDAVFLSGDLSDLLGMELSATLAWDHPTIDDLSDLLAKVVRGEVELPDEAPDWDLESDLFGTT